MNTTSQANHKACSSDSTNTSAVLEVRIRRAAFIVQRVLNVIDKIVDKVLKVTDVVHQDDLVLLERCLIKLETLS